MRPEALREMPPAGPLRQFPPHHINHRRLTSVGDAHQAPRSAFPILRQSGNFMDAWVILGGRRAILPMHGSQKEMKRGTVAAIKDSK